MTFEVLERCPPESLLQVEQRYLDLHFSDRRCLNQLPTAGSARGSVTSAATRERLRLANLGKTHSAETKAKIRLLRTGTTLSEETKQRISASGKGRIDSPETRSKRAESNRGRTVSSETRRKQRDAKLGVPRSAATRVKIGDHFRGRRLPEAHKEKARLAALRRYRSLPETAGKPVTLYLLASRTGMGRPYITGTEERHRPVMEVDGWFTVGEATMSLDDALHMVGAMTARYESLSSGLDDIFVFAWAAGDDAIERRPTNSTVQSIPLGCRDAAAQPATDHMGSAAA